MLLRLLIVIVIILVLIVILTWDYGKVREAVEVLDERVEAHNTRVDAYAEAAITGTLPVETTTN